MPLSISQAYDIFRKMFISADKVLVDFTLTQELSIEEKPDKTLVTACDEQIDRVLCKIATEHSLNIISEEGQKSLNTVQSGNYITIDPIDGTLAYLEYIKDALKTGSISNFLKNDLGSQWDFCLLLGIVEDAKPRFGGVFNYVTKEIILIDSQNPDLIIREGKTRVFKGVNVMFVDQRPGGEIEDELANQPDTFSYPLASFGLRVIYTFINNFESAVTYHAVQTVGLWDVLPGAVAAKAFSGNVYLNNGLLIEYDKYSSLTGKGATAIKGEKFEFLLDKLKLS